MELVQVDDGFSRLEQYKNLIKTAYATAVNPRRTWDKNNRSKDGFYRTQLLLDCDAHRFFTLCADRHYETRSKWDHSCCSSMKVIEMFETEDGIIRFLKQDAFVGIQWVKEPTNIVMRTTPHPKHPWKGPTKTIVFWIKAVDKTKTFLTVISSGPLKMNFPQMEAFARNTIRYLAVYNPWKCSCTKMVPPHELECRACRKARYWRCQNLECFEAQMEDAVKCAFCGYVKAD